MRILKVPVSEAFLASQKKSQVDFLQHAFPRALSIFSATISKWGCVSIHWIVPPRAWWVDGSNFVFVLCEQERLRLWP